MWFSFFITWEQRKFKDMVQIERGGSPRPIDDYITDEPDGLNWVKIGDAPQLGNYITKTAEKIKQSGLSKTREVHPGDLILSNSMSFGKPYIMGINGCIHDGWLLIRDAQGLFELKFLCHLLGTKQMLAQYKALASGSTVNNLNKDLVGNTIVAVPNKDEQQQIGCFLESIDNLITLHQRKQNGLFLLILGKKSSLILANDWEQRKLGDVVSRFATGLNPRDNFTLNSGGKNYYVTIKNFTHGNLVLDDNCDKIDDEALALIQARSDLRIGDILFSSIGRVGDCFLIENKPINWNINESVFVLRPVKDAVDPLYLMHTIHSERVLSIILSCVTGSTFKSIKMTQLKETNIPFPSIAEQKQIGKFITTIDNLITLHQCKGNLVQNKFGLHSPFQMRCKLPDDWEQRKLSEIVSYTASALSAKDVSDSGCYDLYDANSVIGKTNDGIMDHEYITIIKDGAGVGRVRILPAKTAFIGTMGAMTAKNSSLSFVYAMLCSTDLSKRFSGSTIPHIYFKDYGQEQYCVPELCEQDKIAAVFSDIDNLITLHQRGEKIYNRRQTW